MSLHRWLLKGYTQGYKEGEGMQYTDKDLKAIEIVIDLLLLQLSVLMLNERWKRELQR